jgi:hypothetical protein
MKKMHTLLRIMSSQPRLERCLLVGQTNLSLEGALLSTLPPLPSGSRSTTGYIPVKRERVVVIIGCES